MICERSLHPIREKADVAEVRCAVGVEKTACASNKLTKLNTVNQSTIPADIGWILILSRTIDTGGLEKWSYAITYSRNVERRNDNLQTILILSSSSKVELDGSFSVYFILLYIGIWTWYTLSVQY